MSERDRYSKERYNPAFVHCHSMTMKFDGSNVMLIGAGPLRIYPAVSGRPDTQGRFDYSVGRQMERATGPIPAGTYWVRPDELWSNAWYKPVSQSAWGNFRLTIHPFPTTNTFGRGGFFIHGGAFPGSAGCIDLTVHMDRLVRDLRQAVGKKADCQIHIAVEYPRQG